MLLFTGFAPPAQSAEPATTPKKIVTVEGITEYQLDNGLRILLYPDPSTSKVTVNCTVFVGSRFEGYGETGMAHLLEHMVFKGTPTHPNVPKALRDHGAGRNFNGTTWVDRTNYFETMPASDENLEFGIRLEADRLVNSYVKHEDLVSEMTVVRSEFERGENDPENILSQRMMSAAFQWHNYGKSTIGNRSDIERVPIDRLKEFYKKWYQPDNAMLIVAGKFDEQKALDYIAKYFGPLKKPQRKLDETYTDEPPQDGERVVSLRRVGKIGAVGVVYHIPSGTHEDFPAVEVLAQMLSSVPSGRLYKLLVETKKASNVRATAYGFHDPGVLEIFVSVDKDGSLETVRDLLTESLEKMATEPVNEADLNRAKKRLAKNRKLQMVDSNRIGVVLSDWAAKGDWRLFFLHRDRVAQVTAADITRVAKQYLQRNNRTVGLYIPSEQPERAAVPPSPDIEKLVKGYKGGEKIAEGEFFDPSPSNIEKRVQRSQLSTGVKTALLPKKTRGNSVTVELSLNFGNAESLKGYQTATQFLGPMLMRGAKKYNRLQLEDELDALGARVFASSDLSSVSFSITCERDTLPAVLGLLRDVLREPTFPQAEFDTIKRQLRDNLEKNKTEPTALAPRMFQRKLNPYPPDDVRYVPTIEESITRLNDVTVDQVKKLYEEQLSGTSGELVIVGDFDAAKALKAAEDALKDWKAKTPYQRIERPATTDVKGELLVIDTPDKENATYVAGLMLSMTDTDPDYPALEIGNYLFGAAPLASRLSIRIRGKEGLSYGVGSQYRADSQDKSAMFMMFAICNPKNMDKVNASVHDEVGKLLKDGIEAKELAEAKKAYLEGMKQSRASDPQLANALQHGLHVGRALDYYADLEKKIDALTPEQVTAAFRKHLDAKKLVIVEAGDFKAKPKSEK
jgi:zinc protease